MKTIKELYKDIDNEPLIERENVFKKHVSGHLRVIKNSQEEIVYRKSLIKQLEEAYGGDQ